MHASLVVLFGVFALSTSASLGQGGQIHIQTSQNNIEITDENGQQVAIGINQQGALKEVNGPRTIVIQVGGTGRIPKTIEVPDQQVNADGITQSDILQQIFQQSTGVQNAATYQALVDTIAAKVAKGKVNPAVLAALETVSPKNQQDDTAANQIFRQIEQKQLEKQALKDTLKEQSSSQLGSAGEQLVIETGLDQILVANAEGQQVNIATRQQSRLGGPQTIQVQVTGPKTIPRAIRIIDQAASGLSQSNILQQIARQNRGVQDGQTYQTFLSEISVAVANGQINPAVLAALEAVAPQNQRNPAAINQLLDDAQQIAQTQQNVNGGLGLGGQKQIQMQQLIRHQKMQLGGDRASAFGNLQGRLGSQQGFGSLRWPYAGLGRQAGFQSGLDWQRNNYYGQLQWRNANQLKYYGQ